MILEVKYGKRSKFPGLHLPNMVKIEELDPRD